MPSTTCLRAPMRSAASDPAVTPVRRWFERVFRLYQLSFGVERVIVSGPPWDMLITVEWLGHATPRAGAPYENEGAHVIRIRRGRVVYLHAYEDSQKVAGAFRAMAEAGIEG